jgi:hypothetical protein
MFFFGLRPLLYKKIKFLFLGENIIKNLDHTNHLKPHVYIGEFPKIKNCQFQRFLNFFINFQLK